MVDRGRQHCRLSGLSRGEISTKLMDPNNYMKQDFFFENLEFKWVTCPCALGPPLGLSRDGLDTSVCIAVYIDEPCISSKDKHEEQQSESYLVQVLENGFLMNECKWTIACAVACSCAGILYLLGSSSALSYWCRRFYRFRLDYLFAANTSSNSRCIRYNMQESKR
jgi:hypothetical protein